MIPLVVWSQSKPQRNKAFDKTVVEKKGIAPISYLLQKRKNNIEGRGLEVTKNVSKHQ